MLVSSPLAPSAGARLLSLAALVASLAVLYSLTQHAPCAAALHAGATALMAANAAAPAAAGAPAAAAAASPRAPAGGLRGALEALYGRYAGELSAMRALARDFCALPLPAGWPHTNRCLSTIAEMELLYMRVREERPAHVLEVASAAGYTSLWLLSALGRNGNGTLHSFDVFATPFPAGLTPRLAEQWAFVQGDVHETFAGATAGVHFDLILMDAEHTREFGAFYRDTVLAPALVTLQERADAAGRRMRLDMTVHDVYHFEAPFGTSAEGEVFLRWLGDILPTADFSCWTANDRSAPRRFALLEAVQRAALGPAADVLFGQFPRGDLSARCAFFAEPMPEAGEFAN